MAKAAQKAGQARKAALKSERAPETKAESMETEEAKGADLTALPDVPSPVPLDQVMAAADALKAWQNGPKGPSKSDKENCVRQVCGLEERRPCSKKSRGP